uniref:Uncharacterized protein n=1 Tax=Strigops habroptila TaxID=2489341 RepID=A0A672TVR2_STRHB
MAAVLELLLREEVAVAAVVRWLLHGPGHRPAEVTQTPDLVHSTGCDWFCASMLKENDFLAGPVAIG